MMRNNRKVTANYTPSAGTPGEGWGGGSEGNAEVGMLNAELNASFIPHSAFRNQHVRRTPSPTLPRDTVGGGRVASIVIALAISLSTAAISGCADDAPKGPNGADRAQGDPMNYGPHYG